MKSRRAYFSSLATNCPQALRKIFQVSANQIVILQGPILRTRPERTVSEQLVFERVLLYTTCMAIYTQRYFSLLWYDEAIDMKQCVCHATSCAPTCTNVVRSHIWWVQKEFSKTSIQKETSLSFIAFQQNRHWKYETRRNRSTRTFLVMYKHAQQARTNRRSDMRHVAWKRTHWTVLASSLIPTSVQPALLQSWIDSSQKLNAIMRGEKTQVD